MSSITIVDDEAKIMKLLASQLEAAGHTVSATTDPKQALAQISDTPPDILITDLRMQEMDGITLLKKSRAAAPGTDVVIMTAYASVETALETMKEGAYDYIIKPFTTDELLMLIGRIEEKRRLEAENSELKEYLAPGAEEIVGSSEAVGEVKRLIKSLSSSEAPVLIRGESGTGKELVARAIHKTSPRADGPFIAINCAAIPDTLLESELFGYEKGAFTGANKRKLGHYQLANGGTLFLDEIGDMPHQLQSKLLRVLENNRVMPLGSTKEVEVDIRLVTATNRPLEVDIKDGSFREDLFYRINVFPITLPPLRERRDDVAELSRHFLAGSGRSATDLSDEAVRKLQGYHWPGNIRELRNVLERAVIVRPTGAIEAADILLSSVADTARADDTPEPASLNLEDMERQLILRAIKATRGNKSEAARLLGITRRALYGRLERYGIEE